MTFWESRTDPTDGQKNQSKWTRWAGRNVKNLEACNQCNLVIPQDKKNKPNKCKISIGGKRQIFNTWAKITTKIL